jgi:uncharacterized integral membrane protein
LVAVKEQVTTGSTVGSSTVVHREPILSETSQREQGNEAPLTSESEPSSTTVEPTRVSPTRTSASWTAVVGAILLLVLLVVFIAENTQRSTINFLGAHGRAPTAVVLLIAAIAGAGIASTVAIARILQLRKAARDTTK